MSFQLDGRRQREEHVNETRALQELFFFFPGGFDTTGFAFTDYLIERRQLNNVCLS